MKIKIALMLLIILGLALAQNPPPATVDTSRDADIKIESTTAVVDIEDYVVDNFEDAGVWIGEMPRDMGIIRVIRKKGGPSKVTKAAQNAGEYVLGAKVKYFRTGHNWFGIYPPREKSIRGIAKVLSMWVCGRNYNHTIKIIIRDFRGNLNEISLGKINFLGWQELSAQIPSGVIQENYKLSLDRGIKFHSLLINCHPQETSGTFFIYLDNLIAKTDMFAERPENRDPDDMVDDW
ncbi:flagellar filament outer layer protein FlaA [Spirochaetota bacterium]